MREIIDDFYGEASHWETKISAEEAATSFIKHAENPENTYIETEKEFYGKSDLDDLRNALENEEITFMVVYDDER
ncbi:MAG: hypothetical protein BRC26_02965, partial [Nanohaloarchaea archaeon QH_8_44_6]